MKKFQGKGNESPRYIDGRSYRAKLKWVFPCRGCEVYLTREIFGGNNSYCYDCSHGACPICDKVFWFRAVTKQLCCSQKCSRLLNSRAESLKGKKLWKLGHRAKAENPKGKTITCHFCSKLAYKYPRTLKSSTVMFCGNYCFWAWSKTSENPQWKGDAYPANRRLRQSLKAKNWARLIIARALHKCEICGVKRSKTQLLHADHIKSWAMYPELRFDLSNGRALCVPCHIKTDTWGMKAKFQSIYLQQSNS